MEFQEILTYKPSIFNVVALLTLLASAGLGACYYYLFTSFKKGDEDPEDFPFPIIVLVPAAAVIFVISAISFIVTFNLNSNNDEALESNIKQKYNLEELIFNNVNETYEGDAIDTDPKRTGAQNLHVVIDGVTYQIIMEQDRSTWEPTLFNSKVPYEDAKVLDVPIENFLKQK